MEPPHPRAAGGPAVAALTLGGVAVLPAARPAIEVDEDILLARQGDQRAFERLYRTRISGVSRYVGSIVRDRDRTEDITAQTFMLAWRDLPKLRQPERFDAWLFRIAHNQAMTELGRRRPTTALDDAPEIADPGRYGAPERELDYAGDVEHLREAIARLPEMQRQVLVLRYFHDMTPGEIAKQVGKNEQSVWALTYRALQNLKRRLGSESLG
jgi:RNA polymerase sigma-70 factor, ECF subfamily